MHDDALPAAGLLLSDGALEVLAPAMAAVGGTLLEAWPSEVRYDPCRRLAVRFGATVSWGEELRTETLGALVTTGTVPEDLSVVVGPAGERVGVWRYPHDPFLPGLPQAAYPDGARRLMARVGLPGDDVLVEPIVYRPGSRAVLRLTSGKRSAYAKILRPSRLARLLHGHRALEGLLPVPRVLGSSDPLGLVVIEGLPGTAMTTPLVLGGDLPQPSQLLDLLDRIATAKPPPGPPQRKASVADAGDVLAGAVPQLAPSISALVAKAAELGAGTQQLVHGDFYEAQILIRDGAITGLLDLDGLGLGGAGDDVANLIGHLVALAHVYPESAGRILAYAAAVQRAAGPRLRRRGIDARHLRAMVTGVLLGLATTSFRRQETGWRELTGAWIRTAWLWAEGEEALIAVPSKAHARAAPLAS